jgi:hypothetical protein
MGVDADMRQVWAHSRAIAAQRVAKSTAKPSHTIAQSSHIAAQLSQCPFEPLRMTSTHLSQWSAHSLHTRSTASIPGTFAQASQHSRHSFALSVQASMHAFNSRGNVMISSLPKKELRHFN